MHPHFTDASVAKEQGIIAQEIMEYEDSPWERCFQNLLEAMYQRHPIRNNICGSVESIGRITPAMLGDCYRTFYRPSNMVLAVSGDLDPDAVMRVVDRCLPTVTDRTPIERVFPHEPEAVRAAYVEAEMPISKPIFSIGIKDPSVPTDPAARFRRDVTLALLDDVLFSRAGEFYSSLFEEGIITPNFASGYSCAEDFGFHCISGESDTPEVVRDRLREYLARVCENGIDEEDFERCRRVMYADELRAFDSAEEIAGRIVAYALDGVELFSYLPTLQSITREEAEGLLCEMLREELLTLSVIRPAPDRA
jgi:predicted Zn-dependent peptidase